MDEAALNALRNWQSNAKTSHLSPCSKTSPKLDHGSAGPGSFVARAVFELPDGGRFSLLLSGTHGEKAIMPIVENELGLPDGFLVDINTYLLTTLCEDGRVLTPEQVIDAALERANQFFEKLLFTAPPEAKRQKSSSPASSAGDRTSYSLTKKLSEKQGYAAPVFGHSRLSTTTLMKQIALLGTMDTRKDGFIAEPLEDDLYTWDVKLFFDDPSTSIAVDLTNLADHDHVKMEFRFPSEYPAVPPLVRIVSPYISGGHIASHGGICMELLTTSGWAPVNSIDLVCIQIRAMMIQGQARIMPQQQNLLSMYTFHGAMSDLKGIIMGHSWNVGATPRRRRHLPS